MSTPTTAQEVRLSPEQLGYLAAGPGRAVEAALARLIDRGLVRVSRDGLVTAVHQDGQGAGTGIERCVLDLVRTAVPLGTVVETVAHNPETRLVRDLLIQRKLMRLPRHHNEWWWVYLVVAAALALFGLAVPEAFIGVVILVLVAFRLRGRTPLAPAGKALLERTTADDRVLAVALHGFRGKVAGRHVGDLFELPQHVVRTIRLKDRGKKSGSDGGAAVSSCGSGCGSSGCGSSGGSSCSSGGSSGGGGCGGGGGGD